MTAATLPRPAVPATADEPTRLSGPALAVVLTGAYLAIVDFFIVNVALPDMGTDLGFIRRTNFIETIGRTSYKWWPESWVVFSSAKLFLGRS